MVKKALKNFEGSLTAELEEDYDEEVDSGRHERLLESIGVSFIEDSEENNTGHRSEPSKDVSLYSLSQINESGEKSKIKLHQLLKNVRDTGSVNILKKQLNKLHNSSQHLEAPLPKPIADRVQRKVEYEKTTEDVSKWDHIVQKNRRAEHLSFPLNQEPLHIKTVDQQFSRKGKTLTPLEEQIEALLSGNKCQERPDHDFSVVEEEAIKAMDWEEAQQRIAELRKHRALLSYHQAKCKRQKKIKSKSYHRMLKKRKLKEEAKKGVQDEDYEKADYLRIKERTTLRHHSGSKWAKMRKIMSKHDEKTREELEEQHLKHKELVEKRPQSDGEGSTDDSTSDGENIDDFAPPTCYNSNELFSSRKNPWLRSIPVKEKEASHTTTVKDLVLESDATGLKSWLNNEKLSEEKHVTSILPSVATDAVEKFKQAFTHLEHLKNEEDVVLNKSENENKVCEVYDSEGLLETYQSNLSVDPSADVDTLHNADSIKPIVEESQPQMKSSCSTDFLFSDPSKLLSVHQPKLVVKSDVDEAQRMTIEQAFADDDVVAEFQAEKDEIIESSKPTEVELSLPGWGKWGGCGVKLSRKKKSVSLKRSLPQEPRKDTHLGHVILSEKRDVHIAKHQVNQIPFPFVNKEHFEKIVAHPIGSTWNTPETFSRLIKPKVTTAMGTIISPLDSDEIHAKKKSKQQRNKMLQKNRYQVVEARKHERKSKLDILNKLS